MSDAPEVEADDAPEPAAPQGWRRFVRPALRWAERTFAVIGVLFVIYSFCFDLTVIVSPSMSPTLQGGDGEPQDWVLTEKVSGWFCKPSRWQVITFKDREGLQLMKRVVALPGETVSLPDVGKLHIDGKPLEKPERLAFLQYLPAGNLVKSQSVPAGEGWYVLGDHLRDSLDSRFEGPVQKKQVVGHAWLRVWPLSRFGIVR